jgi:hypothetical protein
MEKIEIFETEKLLVYKKSYSPEFIEASIKHNNLRGLRVFDHLDRLDNLDFLNQCSFLQALRIDCIEDKDFSFLKRMPNLEELHIGISLTMKNKIDFGVQKNLKTLGIHWRKGITGLENCVTLKKIVLIDFKENDLEKISKLSSLKQVVIKTSTVKKLNGVEKLIELENIVIGNCKKLNSIIILNMLRKLKKIEILESKSILDIEQFKDVNPNVEILQQ